MRMAILTLGLLAVVSLAMPRAVAKFTGQHTFINGSAVNCEQCHPDIGAELRLGEVHNWSSVSGSSCRVCHIIRISGSDLYNAYGGNTSGYHAAALVECTYCHGNYNGSATGYSTPPVPAANVTAEFENASIEAHRPLYYRARNASGVDTTNYLLGANEACIACHTHAANVSVDVRSFVGVVANFSDCPEGTPGCYAGWNISFWK